jgi:hypothetical protein
VLVRFDHIACFIVNAKQLAKCCRPRLRIKRTKRKSESTGDFIRFFRRFPLKKPAIQPRLNHTPYDISEQRRTQANILGNVTPECYAIADSRRFLQGSDPNGIRTRVTAVKGRCPGPLDDRVTKPGNIGIAIVRRKANW